ncbi:MAG: protein kinase [Gemmatimonadetes bacterium]|nr:protein kinase [Gemmatimonadota bacterium]
MRVALADRYTLERELGQGGMATVYLAHDIRHDRKVAVKVLRPELAAVIGAERFLQEIRVTAHLQHPRLLPLFDSGEADTFLFYVMPYVEGESLRARLVREKQLPLEEAVKITEAVASALDYAHRHKVIHRDIKPENILLHEGQPLIADFGIALAVSVAGGNRLTETGLSLGTPQYMSPEQATGDRQLDARSDIYALGCVLYEMLAGEPPYTGPTTQAIIAKVLTEQPRPLRALRSTVPLLVEAAVQKALQKLPADRFATAADFAEALTKPTAGVPSWRAPLPLTQEAAAAAPLGAFRRWLAVGVGLILLLGGFALGRWLRPLPGGYAPVARLQALFAGGRAVVSIYRLGGDVALSPDGSRLAISADGDQGPGIYLRALDDLEARLLPGTQGGLSPFFSPDGRWVGFWKLGEGRLKKISVAGGPAVPIATATINGGASWGPNDVIITGSTAGGLSQVSAAGGTLQPITQPDSGVTHGWPEILPGGKAVAFTLLSRKSGVPDARIAVAWLSTGKVTVLDLFGTSPHFVPPGFLVYTSADGLVQAVPFDLARLQVTGPTVPVVKGVLVKGSGAVDMAVAGGRTLAYVAGSARRRLVLVDRRGAVRVLSTDSHGYSAARYSPEGGRIAVEIREPLANDIWIYTLASGTLTRLTFGGTNLYPAWTPDGKRVVFGSDRDGAMSLFSVAAAGGGVAERLFSSSNPVWEGLWSPDGRTLIYREIAPATGRDIWYRRAQGDASPRPIARTQFNERAPALSPDGRWLAYQSDESGRDEVYVRPFPPEAGGQWQVSADGGTQPFWGRNGRELFYRHGDQLMVARVETTARFNVRSREVLFSGAFLWGVDDHTNYDVSPDGSHFLMIAPEPGEQTPQVTVVLNWLDELRQRQRTAPGGR